MSAAAKTLSYVQSHPDPQEFMSTARLLIFLKGTNAHDYKFSSTYWKTTKTSPPNHTSS